MALALASALPFSSSPFSSDLAYFILLPHQEKAGCLAALSWRCHAHRPPFHGNYVIGRHIEPGFKLN